MKTKILLVCSFEPWSLGLSYLKAFEKLKYECVCFDMAEEYEKVSPLTRNRYTNSVIFPYAAAAMNKKLLKAAKDCDPGLIFIHKGQWIFPETLKKIKTDTRALLFIFNPDDPFNLNRGASSEFIRNSIPLYDVYFIWSKTLALKLKYAGAKMVEYLPFGFDSELHHPVAHAEEVNSDFNSDVTFVGNWDREREKWLSELKGYELAIWGADYWKTRCRNRSLRASWRGRVVIGDEMSKA